MFVNKYGKSQVTLRSHSPLNERTLLKNNNGEAPKTILSYDEIKARINTTFNRVDQIASITKKCNEAKKILGSAAELSDKYDESLRRSIEARLIATESQGLEIKASSESNREMYSRLVSRGNEISRYFGNYFEKSSPVSRNKKILSSKAITPMMIRRKLEHKPNQENFNLIMDSIKRNKSYKIKID